MLPVDQYSQSRYKDGVKQRSTNRRPDAKKKVTFDGQIESRLGNKKGRFKSRGKGERVGGTGMMRVIEILNAQGQKIEDGR